MCCTPTRRVPIALVLLALACGSALAAPPDTNGAQAYAREQLIREARRIVRPDAVVAKDTDAAKAALAEDMKWRAAWQATTDEERGLLETWDATIAARRLLLGEPPSLDEEGLPLPGSDGALQQARTLLRWLLGDAPEHQGCGVFIRDPRAPNEAARDRGFTYPELPPPASGAATPPDPAHTHETNEGGGLAPVAGTGAVPPATPPPSVTKLPTLDEWARAVRASVGGSLRGKVIGTAVCEDVSRLTEADAIPTPIVEPTVPGLILKRRALEAADPFAYDAAFVAMRRLQAGEWVESMRADSPTQGLVDDGTVRERIQSAEGYAERLKALEQQRDDLLVRLDEMVLDLDNWKTVAAILAVRLEDRRAEIKTANPTPPPEGAPPRAPDLMLRVLSAQETIVAVEMRLLYLAAARSEARLGLLKDPARPSGLLDQLIQLTRDELAAAQASAALFEEELDRVRRERRLDRLQSEARRIRGRIEAVGTDEGLPGAAAQRMSAYQALLGVNDIVQDTVRARRELGNWTLQNSADGPVPPKADDDLAFARNPATAAWDKATLDRWREMLSRPHFDASLVAEHYAVAEMRLRRLRATSRSNFDAAALRKRFLAAVSTAEQALAPLRKSRDLAFRTYGLGSLIEAWRRDFEDSLEGMQRERDRIAARRVAILEYQRELLALGSRSFGIRVVRDLNGEDLAAAAGEALDGLASAGRWVVLDDPSDNAWQYLKTHWFGLLIVLAALIVVWKGTPRARDAIERWLAKLAARYPQIEWAGASVSRERKDAQARKAGEAAAAAARTAALLRSAEEAEKGTRQPIQSDEPTAGHAERDMPKEEAPAQADPEKKGKEVS